MDVKSTEEHYNDERGLHAHVTDSVGRVFEVFVRHPAAATPADGPSGQWESLVDGQKPLPESLYETTDEAWEAALGWIRQQPEDRYLG